MTKRSHRRSAAVRGNSLFAHGSPGALAAALLLGASGLSPATAQTIAPRVSNSEAAQGTFTSTSAGFQSRSGTLDVVQVRGDGVLNWSTLDTQPNGGAFGNAHVNFLPQGTELRFEGTGGPFTAINRVLTVPDAGGVYRPIAMQGRVTSFLSPGGVRGGNIWFYSPGGILATGTAAFNVGSLVLSTSDIAGFARTRFASTANFTGIANPTSRVTLEPGAVIDLPGQRSSLVVFAPSIEQGGTVIVNGPVTYASGATGSLSLASDGTMLVTVVTDAQAGNEIRHTGTTTGAANLAAPDVTARNQHTIEFLSGHDIRVLLSGAIGYEPANSVSRQPNGAIELTTGPVSISGGLALTSDTSISSESPVAISASGGDALSIGGDSRGQYRLRINAPGAELTAAAGGVIDIAGDLIFSDPARNGSFVLTTEAAAGGLQGGRLRIGGRAVFDAVGGGPATGTIEIRDRTTDAGAGMTFGALVATALADTPGLLPTITLETVGNPIVVGQTAELSGDGIRFLFGAGGGLRAGQLALDAGPGGIAIGGSAAGAPATLEALGQIGANSQGDIAAGPGTQTIAGAGMTLFSSAGSISMAEIVSSGSATITAANDISLGTVSIVADPGSPGGLIARAGQGGIATANSFGPQLVTAQAAPTAAANFGNGTLSFDTLTAAGPVTLSAATGISGGALTSGGLAALDSGGAITVTSFVAPDAVLRSSNGLIDARGIMVSGLIDAQGTGVTLVAPGAMRSLARATAGNVAITSGGDLAVDANATGRVSLTSSGRNVVVGDARAGGTMDIAAAQDIAIARTATAGGSLALTAGRLATIDGVAAGQTIDLRAADLAINAGATLGAPATQRIVLSSPATVNLGAGASGGFALDQAEFARIRSGGDLFIEALAGASGGELNVAGGLTVDSGGQIGASGTFGLTAVNGPLTVRGALGIARAGLGNTLALTGNTVDLDYATAALSVVDAADVPTGRIVINGRVITSISNTARADIVGKTPQEISLRLGIADINRTTSLFRARNLALNGVDAVLIQNSGPGAAIDDRRGINVGALTVTGAPDGHTLVVINGEIADQSGVNAARIVTFTTPVVQGSTVNGCVLGNIDACLGIAILAPAAILFETPALIEDDNENGDDPEGVDDGESEGPPIDTHLVDDPAGRPMIDDPVTGAGNEDLWQVPESAPQAPQG